MSKKLRLHAPGCVFHITARTQGRQAWFIDELKPRVQSEIKASAVMAGMTVFAHIVMPNHFHIVVRQGNQPLAYMMHRVMHRAAAMLKRAYKMDGHVFGQPYWSGLCSTPAHVRRAIIYTHLNASRACLCRNPDDYIWSSHREYVNPTNGHRDAGHEEGLRFFAGDADDEHLKQYLEHVRFQMSIDSYIRGELAADSLVPPPVCRVGDTHWDRNYRVALEVAARATPKTPIYDVACRLLEQLDARCSLDLLRTGLRGPKISPIRRNLVAALLTAGYRGTQIARLLGMSTSAISKVAISLRT